MEDKYFTPSIEDIHVGYECEVYSWDCPLHEITKDYRPKSWKKTIWTEHDFDESAFDRSMLKDIRVPYLTKEQIEAEGWEQRGANNFFYKGQYQVVNNPIPDCRCIKITNCTSTNWRCLYEGECKDINTFRYICKLLGI